MTDQKNTLLAIVLSAVVLIVWQYFVGLPQMEKQKQEALLKQQQQQQQQQVPQPGQPVPAPQTGQPGQAAAPAQLPGQGGASTPSLQVTREAVIGASPRVADRHADGCAARSRCAARRSTTSR